MCGLLKLLRATLLGACLCIAAAQLGHVEGAGAAESSRLVELRGLSRSTRPAQEAQWSTCVACSAPDQAPSDSQMPGDLGSIDSSADDSDDIDDASLHAHLALHGLDFGVCAQKRAVQHESLRMRREDRRCDKPPRQQPL